MPVNGSTTPSRSWSRSIIPLAAEETPMLTYDHYVSASTLADAFDALDAIPGARLIAGGTDLLPWAREGRAGDVHLPALIDVSAIAELGALSLEGARLAIGAAVPISAIEDDLRLVGNPPWLGRSATGCAHHQIL